MPFLSLDKAKRVVSLTRYALSKNIIKEVFEDMLPDIDLPSPLPSIRCFYLRDDPINLSLARVLFEGIVRGEGTPEQILAFEMCLLSKDGNEHQEQGR